jgi:PIN domain nuclease of toxin-antitoxin system
VRLLLDTHVFLWFLADSPKLTKKARTRIERADDVFISAASIWEATIKSGIGKLDVDPAELVAGIEASGFAELPIRARHAARVALLAREHRDPFDRILLAQAIDEPLRLLTADSTLEAYSELVELI